MSEFTEADRAQIRGASETALAAMNAQDMTGFVHAMHAEDVTLLPPGAPAVHGRSAVIAFLEEFPAFRNMTFDQLQVEGEGNLAYVRGAYSFDFLDEDGNVIGKDVGSYLEVWRRDADGWAVIEDIFNSDMAHE